jgi:hypothetical protein
VTYVAGDLLDFATVASGMASGAKKAATASVAVGP